MGRTQGLVLFTLTFPPTHRVKMVFATDGLRVVMGDDREGMKGLLDFLICPPEGLFPLLERVVTPPGAGFEDGGTEEEEWPSMGWDEVGHFFNGGDLEKGIRVDFPPALTHLVSGLEKAWLNIQGRDGGHPLSFYFSVERGGREMVVTTISLFRGGDVATIVDLKSSKVDVEVHRALMTFFFLVLGRLVGKVVALLRLLRALGVIIFF